MMASPGRLWAGVSSSSTHTHLVDKELLFSYRKPVFTVGTVFITVFFFYFWRLQTLHLNEPDFVLIVSYQKDCQSIGLTVVCGFFTGYYYINITPQPEALLFWLTEIKIMSLHRYFSQAWQKTFVKGNLMIILKHCCLVETGLVFK